MARSLLVFLLLGQPRKRPEAAVEVILFGSHFLEHAEEEVAERLFPLAVDVLAVLEASAGEKDGEVVVAVATSAAEAGTKEDLGGVQHWGAVGLFGFLELGEEVGEVFHQELFDDGELAEAIFPLAVVGKGVVAFGDSVEAPVAVVHIHGNDTCGIGLQGEEHEVQPDADEVAAGVFITGSRSDLFDGGVGHFGFGLVNPLFGQDQFLFGFPNGGKVLFEFVLVFVAELLLEAFGITQDSVQDAATGIQGGPVELLFLGRIIHKHEAEGVAGFLHSWDTNTCAGKTHALAPEKEGGIAGEVTHQFRCPLVDGDVAVRVPCSLSAQNSAEQSMVGRVTSTDSVVQVGEGSEVAFVFGQRLQGLGKFVVLARRGWMEFVHHHAEGHCDCGETRSLAGLLHGFAGAGKKGFHEWECDAGTSTPEDGSARDLSIFHMFYFRISTICTPSRTERPRQLPSLGERSGE